LARISSRLALVPLLLLVSLVGVRVSYAFRYGSVTITSAPYSMETGNDPSISVHAEWSGLAGMLVRVGLYVRNDYGAFSSDANITSYNATCQSGCQSNLADGEINATFSLTAEASYPSSSIYLYPSSLTVYATLSQCALNGMLECTVIASSQPVTITLSVIGEPPAP